MKQRLRYDDALDAFGIHGIGGIVGADAQHASGQTVERAPGDQSGLGAARRSRVDDDVGDDALLDHLADGAGEPQLAERGDRLPRRRRRRPS